MKIKTDNNIIRIETDLSVSPESAWHVLTQAQHITRWWGDHVHIEPKAGGTFREEWFDSGKRVITTGTITIFNPPTELAMTWADDDWPGYTTVTISFTEESNGTHLLLEHSGWYIHPENKQKSLMAAHAQGWSHYLNQFAEYTKTIK